MYTVRVPKTVFRGGRHKVLPKVYNTKLRKKKRDVG